MKNKIEKLINGSKEKVKVVANTLILIQAIITAICYFTNKITLEHFYASLYLMLGAIILLVLVKIAETLIQIRDKNTNDIKKKI